MSELSTNELDELIVRLKAQVMDTKRKHEIAHFEYLVSAARRQLAQAEAGGDEHDILYAKTSLAGYESLQAITLLRIAEEEKAERQG